MSKLTIIADIIAKEDKVDLITTELLKLISISRAEDGCINYNLHQDNNNPAHFTFYENWASRELWQTHMANKHLSDFKAATEGAFDSFIVSEMTQVD
ncbi:putative quinol monooxygenase [Thaumasiovibrio sp. DFM-14]|uniref:putative quinol monooxygenase n=1 Tax=Thaumasiovibrio sp. DFM-14 TaxID=3384792 RepID=UPI0039A083D4